MGHEAFRSRNYDTHFVRDHFTPEVLEAGIRRGHAAAALVAAVLREERLAGPVPPAGLPPGGSPGNFVGF